MSALLFELIRVALGVAFGLLAMAFAVSTFRLMAYGQDAYRSNRRLTPRNPFEVWRGKMKRDAMDIDGRASHGVAIDIQTGCLEAQRRLSTEAIDDIIGRPAG